MWNASAYRKSSRVKRITCPEEFSTVLIISKSHSYPDNISTWKTSFLDFANHALMEGERRMKWNLELKRLLCLSRQRAGVGVNTKASGIEEEKTDSSTRFGSVYELVFFILLDNVDLFYQEQAPAEEKGTVLSFCIFPDSDSMLKKELHTHQSMLSFFIPRQSLNHWVIFQG